MLSPVPALLLGLLSMTLGTQSVDLALVGGTIYPGPQDEKILDGVVLIRDGSVSAVGPRASTSVPPGVPSIDCSGLTIVAGFWNSHVHFFERKWANAATAPASDLERQIQDMLTRFGFTSVFDTGSMWENTRALRQRIDSLEVPGPRIRSTGEALVAPGAMPPERILAVLGFMAFPAPEVRDASEAATESRNLLARGVDGIKVHLQPPPPPQPPFPEGGIAAAVEEAHRLSKPAFVHPNTGADVLAALRAGADVIAHTTPRSGPWDAEILEATKAKGAALTPTLALWKSVLRHDPVSAQDRLTEVAVGQLRAFVEAGGTVLFGTDLGAIDYDPGEEYALLAEAGMGFEDVLASLTTAPAERFGESSRLGRILPGLEADLVVLKDDPETSIQALRSVRYTLRSGRFLYRAPD
jgi:imidazolonepropionase-like amidohydrolase